MVNSAQMQLYTVLLPGHGPYHFNNILTQAPLKLMERLLLILIVLDEILK